MIESIKIFALSSSNLGSLVAGLLVFFISGFIVFLIKEKLKKPPSLSGVFYLKTTTENSAMKTYEGLSSIFILTLINESATKAIGKIEKIYDIEKNGFHRSYIGKDRNTGDVLLTVERYYLGRNRINIHISLNGDANGMQRPSSLVVALNRAKLKTKGIFTTTAADAKGIAVFQNEEFQDKK
ncbi:MULTISPECIES: hypothetical protein [unclassified Brenneria]|uniref:hypothetical protein n=1 Tax=unclassified Brenneria TaxID=2634434 RepID=UPI0029C41105|nr:MULTISPECIES: hypothetical protein [unclassified Brenneria]MDX5629603.1 hypothetical protein [Brenneria sp. L3-3Z]MDX5696749.1 hypothetical protein [Brenneria sp. L4-2C]